MNYLALAVVITGLSVTNVVNCSSSQDCAVANTALNSSNVCYEAWSTLTNASSDSLLCYGQCRNLVGILFKSCPDTEDLKMANIIRVCGDVTNETAEGSAIIESDCEAAHDALFSDIHCGSFVVNATVTDITSVCSVNCKDLINELTINCNINMETITSQFNELCNPSTDQSGARAMKGLQLLGLLLAVSAVVAL